MTTFSDLITQTTTALSMVTGPGVQKYAEDRIAQYLQEIFDVAFSELWWPDYMQWFERTIDGTDGVVTANIDTVLRFEDIRAVFKADTDITLTLLPSSVNPFNISGTTVRYYEGLAEDTATKVIQFWPKTSTDSVVIAARVHPSDFISTDIVKMDRTLLTNGAAWKYSEDRGTNPGATQKFQISFESRLNQLKIEYNDKPLKLDPHFAEIPTEWFVP